MMRMAGGGEDVTAKSLKSDNAGIIKIKQTPISLETIHHNSATATGNGTSAIVAGYSAIAFHVFGSFVGRVYFEGNINAGVWEKLPVVNEIGIYTPFATKRGIYKADISGYREVRARLEWTSGANITIRSLATLSGSTKDLVVNLSRQNVLLHSIESNFLLNKNKTFYGNMANGTTSISSIVPVDYGNHSKKTVFISNKTDRDVKIASFFKYTQFLDGADFLEQVDVDIVVSAGKTNRLSCIDFPELLDPFLGLGISIQSIGEYTTSGTVKIK